MDRIWDTFTMSYDATIGSSYIGRCLVKTAGNNSALAIPNEQKHAKFLFDNDTQNSIY